MEEEENNHQQEEGEQSANRPKRKRGINSLGSKKFQEKRSGDSSSRRASLKEMQKQSDLEVTILR
jgi:hypothetical protein